MSEFPWRSGCLRWHLTESKQWFLKPDYVLETPGRLFKVTDQDQALTPEILDQLVWDEILALAFFGSPLGDSKVWLWWKSTE